MARILAARFGLFFPFLHVFLVVILAIPSEVFAGLCSQRLSRMIPFEIDQYVSGNASLSHAVHQFLLEEQADIEKAILEKCPDPDSCDLEKLAEIVQSATQEKVNRFVQNNSGWKGNTVLLAFVASYTVFSAWVAVHSQSMAAGMFCSLLTLTSGVLLTKLAARWEIPIENLRCWMCRIDKADPREERGRQAERHQVIFRRAQGFRTASETEARGTDRENITQTNVAGLASVPQVGETRRAFLIRSADIFAATLADLHPKYPEIVLLEPDYANYARSQFSTPHLNDSNRQAFQDTVLLFIEFRYNKEPGFPRREQYERIIRAWTQQVERIDNPLEDPQLRLMRPSLQKVESFSEK